MIGVNIPGSTEAIDVDSYRKIVSRSLVWKQTHLRADVFAGGIPLRQSERQLTYSTTSNDGRVSIQTISRATKVNKST